MRLLLLALLLVGAPLAAHAQNGISTRLADPATKAVLKEKLQLIILDKVDFDNADLATVAKTLTQLSKDADPDHSGVTIVSQAPAAAVKITLHVQTTSLADVLSQVSTLSALTYAIENNQIVFKAPAK